MNKSPDAFRTISEVAEQLDVPAHVLRFWETRFSQVKPIKRGGGRRYYRPDDVRLLRGIRGLLYDNGMTIKGVQKILREQGVRHVIALGTEDETKAPAPAMAFAPASAPAIPVGAEPVLATAGGDGAPSPPKEAALADGARNERRQSDLFGAAAVVDEKPDAVHAADAGAEPQPEDIEPAINSKIDREALRRLVADLEALRRVMAEQAPG